MNTIVVLMLAICAIVVGFCFYKLQIKKTNNALYVVAIAVVCSVCGLVCYGMTGH